MMIGVMLLVLLFEQWRARRRLRAHINAVAGAQTRAAKIAMQVQREQYEQQRPR